LNDPSSALRPKYDSRSYHESPWFVNQSPREQYTQFGVLWAGLLKISNKCRPSENTRIPQSPHLFSVVPPCTRRDKSVNLYPTPDSRSTPLIPLPNDPRANELKLPSTRSQHEPLERGRIVQTLPGFECEEENLTAHASANDRGLKKSQTEGRPPVEVSPFSMY